MAGSCCRAPHARRRAPAHRVQERFDWTGALLLGPVVGLLLLALTFGNSWGWTSPRLIVVSILVLVCFGAFVAGELRAVSPLVDLALFHSRQFSAGIVAGLLAYAVLFGSLFLVPFYLERLLGHTAAETGLLLSPVPLALAVVAPLAGLLTDRVGPRLPTVVGMAMSAFALIALGLLPGPDLLLTLPTLALLGVGQGLFTAPNNSSVMATAPADRLGTAGGVLNMTRSLGTSLGVALSGAVMALILSGETGQHVASTLDAPPSALYVALHGTLIFLAGLAGLAGVLSMARGMPAARAVVSQHSVVAESIGV